MKNLRLINYRLDTVNGQMQIARNISGLVIDNDAILSHGDAYELCEVAVQHWEATRGFSYDPSIFGVHRTVEILFNYIRHRLTNYDQMFTAVQSRHRQRFADALSEVIEDRVYELMGDVHPDVKEWCDINSKGDHDVSLYPASFVNAA